MNNLQALLSWFHSDPELRVKARYALINRLAKRNGFRLASRRFSVYDDRPVRELFERGGYTFNDKKYMIYQLALGVQTVPGHTAECGVFQGRGSYLILEANLHSGKQHHIFDSFEGVSKPDDRDIHGHKHTKEWGQFDMAFPEESLRQRFQSYQGVHYHKGWIPEKFHEVSNEKFSFVHIDVDLYQPTYDSIAHFYPLLSPGGIILCDDYAADGTPGARKAMDEFFADKPENVVCTVPGSGFIIKQ